MDVDDLSWQDHARCAGMDPALFYPGRGETISPEAEAACRSCPVAGPCLDWALRHESHGYWAGHSERSRRRLRRTLRITVVDLAPSSIPLTPPDLTDDDLD